jgi:hypothetical protein|tara:strand:- start:1221 stop:1436 length:216 start_codon:yes stop_codon:yes gene_type:complete
MIETVVALLMIVHGEIKEHRIQDSMSACLRGKRTAERQFSAGVKYQCIKSKAELEENVDGSRAIKKIILAE